MRNLLTLLALACASFAFGQDTPVALHTSDPRFAAKWVDVPAPALPFLLERHSAGWTEGRRQPGTYEIAYCLTDEEGKVSPVSSPVTVTTATNEWAAVGSTPNVPLWARAAGIFWVYRVQGATTWKPFAVDVNRPHSWLAAKPYKPITTWNHSYAGQVLYQAGIGFPDLPDPFYGISSSMPNAPPAPSVQVYEQPNVDLEIAFSWPCNERETALSPVLSVPAIAGVPSNQHKSMWLIRQSPAGNQQPPQGALGMYVYARKPGQAWHRQPSTDGNGYLWPLDFVTFELPYFKETNIAPQAGGGRSYLSRLHVALKEWDRDIIVDYDETICCPLISEYDGGAWKYQPRNSWVAILQPLGGAWKMTIDGVSTPDIARVTGSNNGTEWPTYQAALDATFGAGNLKVTFYWHNYAPKIEFIGKYAAQDMAGRYSVGIEPVVASQAGQGWVYGAGGNFKFKRTIGTGNGGSFKITDTDVVPADGAVTGYPTGWCMWLECSQRTVLRGADFTMYRSKCAIGTCDNSGGGSFHFNVINGSMGLHFSNTQDNTYGIRCLGSSSWGWGGHLCSEMILEKCHIQARWPIVCEGNQAANWQLRDLTCTSTGKFQSAIITQANAGDLIFVNRLTCDNARSLVAGVWGSRTKLPELWIDGGMPCLYDSDANNFGTLMILGGKINQWEQDRDDIIDALVFHGWGREQLETMNGWDLRNNFSREMSNWIHAISAPAGTLPANVKRTLVIDELSSQYDLWPPPQQNRLPDARMICPVANQNVFAPRDVSRVPALLQSLLP